MKAFLLLSWIGIATCSRGDWSTEYRICTDTCRRRLSCPSAFSDLGWANAECFRCRYACVWQTVDVFQRQGEDIPQFHGKWPFFAIDLQLVGISIIVQEPASAIFSIANFVGVYVMYKRIKKFYPTSGRRMWVTYSFVGMITWTCSTMFHTIDVWLTEYLDYFSACGYILFALYASAHVVFPKLNFTSQGRLLSRLLGSFLICFYIRHVFNLYVHFDYGWNMACCIAASVATSLLYAYHVCTRFKRFSRISKSDRLLLKMMLLANGSVLLELFDFPPIFWYMEHERVEKICDLPFAAEYAKSDRSTCKKCKNHIGQSSLRISVREPSRFFDGIQDNWFHVHCFFTRLGAGKINERSIRGLENLKWEDQVTSDINNINLKQEMIREKIAGIGIGGAVNSEFPRYRAEYSKSNRGKCFSCKKCFATQELKIGKQSSWYHHDCILKTEQPAKGNVADIGNFTNLKPEDQKMLIDTYSEQKENTGSVQTGTTEAIEAVATPAGNEIASSAEVPTDDTTSASETVPKKRFRFEPKVPVAKDDFKEKLKRQTELMWELREKFQQNMKKEDMSALLQANQQIPPEHAEQVLELLVDCATFGKPARCPKCDGQIVFNLSNRCYTCLGYITEYTKCPYSDSNPLRSPFMIPYEMYKKFAFLKGLKVNVLTKRTYPEMDDQKIIDRSENNAFAHLGARAMKHVEEAYCEGRREGYKPSHRKIIKHGTVVDGDFELAERCHVHRDPNGELCSVVLTKSDLVSNSNSYYRIQLLKDDMKDDYYVFRSWGRVGTDIGGTTYSSFRRVDYAIQDFYRAFMEKTGNKFEDKAYFQKKAGYFDFIETDYAELESAPDAQAVLPGSKTKLPRPVKDIIMMISDVENLKKQLNELELDTTKMPLGKLSKQQLKNAYSVLTELQEVLDGDRSPEKIIDCSNRFYTLIPHDFGMKSAPLLDNINVIKEKCAMLDTLMDFQLAADMINQDKGLMTTRDPVDVNYEKLKCTMEVVEQKTDEYKLIETYLKNTHGETHSFKLRIIDVLRIEREGEAKKFARHIGNRRLLWHGSRVGNYMGILSQGLRIAPPEAPVQGYMFGKGVYFADMVSKSAQYSQYELRQNEGLILLAEVALGEMQEEFNAKNIVKPNKGFNSVKGMGFYTPAEDHNNVHIDNEGYKIVFGKAKTPDAHAQNNYSLRYNEYIVYDTDQIRLRYLVRISFK